MPPAHVRRFRSLLQLSGWRGSLARFLPALRPARRPCPTHGGGLRQTPHHLPHARSVGLVRPGGRPTLSLSLRPSAPPQCALAPAPLRDTAPASVSLPICHLPRSLPQPPRPMRRLVRSPSPTSVLRSKKAVVEEPPSQSTVIGSTACWCDFLARSPQLCTGAAFFLSMVATHWQQRLVWCRLNPEGKRSDALTSQSAPFPDINSSQSFFSCLHPCTVLLLRILHQYVKVL